MLIFGVKMTLHTHKSHAAPPYKPCCSTGTLNSGPGSIDMAEFQSEQFFFVYLLILARACGIPVSWRSGGRLATTLVATINIIFSHSIFPSFWGPLVAILDFAGGGALQAVRCGIAGGERVPPSPLGWYCFMLPCLPVSKN